MSMQAIPAEPRKRRLWGILFVLLLLGIGHPLKK